MRRWSGAQSFYPTVVTTKMDKKKRFLLVALLICLTPLSLYWFLVAVHGTAQFVRPKTSRKGNDYETFSLCEQVCVNVFTWGHPLVADGKRLTVSGTFAAVKHVGRYTFHNEIDADEGSL
jgi:hypothetical protein